MSSFRTGSASGPLSIERVVALLTPAFSAAAGWLTTVIAHNIPGVTIPQSDFVAIFGFGAAAALGAAIKWLHGRQLFTSAVHELRDVSGFAHGVPGVADLEKVLEQHKADILHAIEKAIHLPPSADDIVNALARRAGGSGATAGAPQTQAGAGTAS